MKKVIDVTFPKGKQVNANIKGFDILADQPVRAGGDGEAPGPFDFFLSSIASCAGFYASSFCQSREIDTTGMSLELLRKVDPETRMVSDIQIKLNLPEGFPRKYSKAIIKAMDQCSVKKHLVQPPMIETIAE